MLLRGQDYLDIKMLENTIGVVIVTSGKNIKGLKAIKEYYCNLDNSISIYIVYKNDKINQNYFYDLFKECNISLNVIRQEKGGFINALNLAFNEIKEPIIIMNDDDVIHMPNNLRLISNYFSHEDIGIITGNSLNQRIYPFKQLIAMILNYHLDKEPLSPLMSSYLVEINRSGLLSMSFSNFIKKNLYNKQIQEYMTMRPYGASLALRRRCIENFEIPEISLRGIGFETVIAWHCLEKYNLHTIFSPRFVISHEERKESLSRTQNSLQITFEFYLLPLILHLVGSNINIKQLRKTYNKFKKISGFNNNMTIALKALELDIELINSNISIDNIKNKIIEIERNLN
jgi:hypothetical protein